MTRRPASLALLAVVALAGTGCGKLREVSAGRKIARDVNSAVSDIEALSRQKPIDEPRIAKRYVELAQALEPQSVGEKPLALAVRDYAAILRATDVQLRAHAEAAKTQYGRVY